MASSIDLEILRDMPGYDAVLKAILKNQIKILVQQLCEETGEEAIILTTSLRDGSFSNLGSESGKTFILTHSDIKAQFQVFCKDASRKKADKRRPEFLQEKPVHAYTPKHPRLSTAANQGEGHYDHSEATSHQEFTCPPTSDHSEPHIVVIGGKSGNKSSPEKGKRGRARKKRKANAPEQSMPPTQGLPLQIQQHEVFENGVIRITLPNKKENAKKSENKIKSKKTKDKNKKTFYYFDDGNGAAEAYEVEESDLVDNDFEDPGDPAVDGDMGSNMLTVDRQSVVTMGTDNATPNEGVADAMFTATPVDTIPATVLEGTPVILDNRVRKRRRKRGEIEVAINHPVAPAATVPQWIKDRLARNADKLRCKHCNFVCLREDRLTIHMRQHNNQTPFKCTLCGVCIRHESTMKRHLINKHKFHPDDVQMADYFQDNIEVV